MWISLLAVMIKELRQAFRDRRTAFLLLVAPVIQLVVLGYAVDLDVEEIPTIVVDQDRTPASRALADALTAGSVFERTIDTPSVDLAQRLLEDGEVAVALVIPPGFQRDTANGRTAAVQVLLDGTDPNRAQVASAGTSQFVQIRALATAQSRLEAAAAAQGAVVSLPKLGLEPRIFYNPSLDSAKYMVPGVLGMLLVLVSTLVTAMGLAREREAGTMEQLMVTPLRPSVLLAGKCLPFAVVGLVDVAAVLLFGSLLFEVPMRGPLWVVFLASSLYLLTTLGTGIFVSSITSSQQQAVLASFFFLMPAVLLSGFMTPIENMPAWVQPITWLNPMRYFVTILRACLLKGAGLADLARELLALLLFGVGILTFSALKFHKRLA